MTEVANITKLPTAARRKVRQCYRADAPKAIRALPKFPGEYIRPSLRSAMRIAADLVEARHQERAEIYLIEALITAMPADCRNKARQTIETLALLHPGSHAAQVARSVFIAAAPMAFADQCDLTRALKRLGGVQ